MTIRFPAELPYNDSLPLISVGDLVNQGRIVEAVNFMAANQVACANALGAVNYWRAKFEIGVPVYYKARLGSTTYKFDYLPAMAVAFDCDHAGIGSASIEEGGEGLYGAVFDVLPVAVAMDEWQTWGKVAVNALAMKPGQFLVLFSESPKVLPGRADVQ